MSSVVDARPVVETTPARRHHRHHRHRAAVGVTARARRWARPSVAVTARGDGNVEEGGSMERRGAQSPSASFEDEEELVRVQDDLTRMLGVLPEDVRGMVRNHPQRKHLLEIVLDLGRAPEARFLGDIGSVFLREAPVTEEELVDAADAVGDFGGDNRAGIEGTLHRISCIRNRRGRIVGMTCRVGRAVTGHIDMIRDVLPSGESVLFLGRPGVGKTTVIREMARVLSDELKKRVVIIDTSNEIGGDGDVAHPAIGGARRMQVPDPSMQHRVMIEAVENHMPEVIIVDEIGTEAEALACRTIAERGVQLIGTAHGQLLENLIKNPTLADLVGGVQTVTLGDDEARARGCQKSILERQGPPTFPILIEMHERNMWVAHNVAESVDEVLTGARPVVQLRTRDPDGEVAIHRTVYDMDVSLGTANISHTLGAMGGIIAPTSRVNNKPDSSEDDPYAWVDTIGIAPDKDVAMEAYGGFKEKKKRGKKTRASAKRSR